MPIEATSKTAAIAGAWSALGLVSLDTWLDHHKSISVLTHNATFLVFGAVFLLIPAYFLVIGRANEPFSRTWFISGEERARYGAILRRTLVWFVSAGVFAMVSAPVLDFALRKLSGS